MKKTLLFLSVLALATAPVNALQVDGNKLVLSADEARACAEQGGCALLTRAQFEREVVKAFEAGKLQCGMRT